MMIPLAQLQAIPQGEDYIRILPVLILSIFGIIVMTTRKVQRISLRRYKNCTAASPPVTALIRPRFLILAPRARALG